MLNYLSFKYLKATRNFVKVWAELPKYTTAFVDEGLPKRPVEESSKCFCILLILHKNLSFIVWKLSLFELIVGSKMFLYTVDIAQKPVILLFENWAYLSYSLASSWLKKRLFETIRFFLRGQQQWKTQSSFALRREILSFKHY